MRNTTVATLTQALPTGWVKNYTETFEAGRVQKHPQARFVNRRGECCLVAALVGAETAADVVRGLGEFIFLGGELEELSRRFEAWELTGQQFYEECLLTLTARTGAASGVASL